MAAGSTINHHLPFEPIESPLSMALLELHFEMKAYNSIIPTKRSIMAPFVGHCFYNLGRNGGYKVKKILIGEFWLESQNLPTLSYRKYF